ncbi:hypothetical protein CT138_08755 [Mannheimia varigena]|nr:hypothetical protein CT138_08755 [Mannheimia varigena]TLU76466.1 hypothetical protein FE589_03270 [Mannheimia varigena]
MVAKSFTTGRAAISSRSSILYLNIFSAFCIIIELLFYTIFCFVLECKNYREGKDYVREYVRRRICII